MDYMGKFDYWMDMVEYDLETADAMLETSRFLYVGFMCHQAVEKALKAYHWKAKESDPPYIHNLMRLAEASGLIDSLSEKRVSLINKLNPLNLEARYPREKERLLRSLSRDICSILISDTKELVEWIRTK